MDDGLRIRKVHHKSYRRTLENALGLRVTLGASFSYRANDGVWHRVVCETPALDLLLGFHPSTNPDDDDAVIEFNEHVRLLEDHAERVRDQRAAKVAAERATVAKRQAERAYAEQRLRRELAFEHRELQKRALCSTESQGV